MAPNELNVLVVDDDSDDIFLIRDYLSEIDTFKINIDTESNYAKARNKILLNQHDLYIVDYLLGPETGLELMIECGKAGVNKPFILLTGKGDKKIDIQATRAGAYDYLTKTDLNSELLERSIRYSIQRYSSYRAIAENEKKYREIFTRSNDIIFIIDKSFCFIDFNPMMAELMGYTIDELRGAHISALFKYPEDVNRFVHHIEFSTGTNIEITLLTKSGESKSFLASCSRIVNQEGVGQYQGILYDYTTMKKSVAEQTLKEKIEATNRLVRSLAHEIRNPLTNINLSVHQLEADLDEDKQLFADIIKRNSKRIADLIGELMNLSNPAEGANEVIELKDIVRETLNVASDRIGLKEINVVEQFEPKEVFIKGNRKKMQMALLNIIINAIEAMESGKGVLSLTTLCTNGTASIKIKDNGVGIAAENMSHLFQPFFTGKKNGMGLGLATTNSVIQAHNGSIEVESAVGKGTTFTINLKTI